MQGFSQKQNGAPALLCLTIRRNQPQRIAEQGRRFTREHADCPDQSPRLPSSLINQQAKRAIVTSTVHSICQLSIKHISITKISRKLEVSKDTTSRYLTMGRPPTEVDCAARRKQPARPLHVISHPPSPSHAKTPYPRPAIAIPLQRPKPTPAKSTHATSISLASSPKPQPQTSKQSRARVRNIV